MESTWNTMEKKEKILWIKKAAEDQKRYEVRRDPEPCCVHFPLILCCVIIRLLVPIFRLNTFFQTWVKKKLIC